MHVFDASALLAYAKADSGTEAIDPLLTGFIPDPAQRRLYASTLSLSELLGFFSRYGVNPYQVMYQFLNLGFEFNDFDQTQAMMAAQLAQSVPAYAELTPSQLATLCTAKHLSATLVTADPALAAAARQAGWDTLYVGAESAP